MDQKIEGGTVIESTIQKETENLIFKETESRFKLAKEAPISSTKLIDQLGYLSDNKIDP